MRDGRERWWRDNRPPAPPPAAAGPLEYRPGELEFLAALDRYKRQEGRPQPTWREVFAVLVSVGFRKVAPAGEPPAYAPPPVE